MSKDAIQCTPSMTESEPLGANKKKEHLKQQSQGKILYSVPSGQVRAAIPEA